MDISNNLHEIISESWGASISTQLKYCSSQILRNILHTIEVFDIISPYKISETDLFYIGLIYHNPRKRIYYGEKYGYKRFIDHMETKKCKDGSIVVIFSPYTSIRDPDIPSHFHKTLPLYDSGASSYICHFTGHGSKIVFNHNIKELLETNDYLPNHIGYNQTNEHFNNLVKI